MFEVFRNVSIYRVYFEKSFQGVLKPLYADSLIRNARIYEITIYFKKSKKYFGNLKNRCIFAMRKDFWDLYSAN